MKIQQKIKNRLIRFSVTLWPETAEQKAARGRLVSEVSRLANEGSKSADQIKDREDAWNKYRITLRSYIEKNDPRNFLRWDPIVGSMFHFADKGELEHLQKSQWDKWRKVVVETWVGNPPRYKHYRDSSGNLVHTAYNLSLLIDACGIDLKKIHTIIEFGGGYGLMTRIVHQLGFSGSYTIFDIPEFLALQKYYLQLTGTSGKISSIDQVSKITTINPDIFIATWSLSESPIALREEFLKKIGTPSYVLIAYQATFGSIDNSTYFAEYQKARAEYQWTHFAIPQIPGNYYLIGKKI